MQFGLQAITLRIAAVSWINCAEKTDDRDSALCDLITRIPFTVIAPRRDAEAIRIISMTIS